MPSYKRVIIYFYLIFFIFGCSTSQSKTITNNIFEYKTFAQEDKYILFAWEYNRIGNKEKAREYYLKLFTKTLNDEYLFEYSKLSFILAKYNELILIVDLNRKNINKNEADIFRLYILSLIQKKEFDKAKLVLEDILKKDKIDSNYALLGTIYVNKSKFKEAKDIFKKIYIKSLNESSLINLTNVMYLYLNEKKEAINYLESHVKLYGCSSLICSKLLSYYQKDKNIDGIISILKKTYFSLEKQGNHVTIKKVYNLLMYYMEKKDIKEAILFLEDSKADDKKLLSLYRKSSDNKKAYALIKSLYEKTSNIDYLAQIAMLEFEIAKNKKDVIQSVIKKFKDVLVILDSPVYQNYLGYILIDFDINVKEGLQYVKQALTKDPNNLAYIDSLAWALYKLKDCKNAYINMKKVVDGAGLSDIEIKTHWNKIKECNK